MDKIFLGILIIICGMICWQDLRQRAVHWILFPLLLVFSFLLSKNTVDSTQWLFNLMFLIFLMAGLTLYLTLKSGKLINITQGFFSWGDIFFLIAVIPLFDFTSYMLFFTVGTLLTLVTHGLTMVFRSQQTIPYAGYMAIFCSLYLLFEVQSQHLIRSLV